MTTCNRSSCTNTFKKKGNQNYCSETDSSFVYNAMRYYMAGVTTLFYE